MTSVLGLKLNRCIEADSIIMFCHLGHVDDTVREGWVGEEQRDHGGGRRKCPTRRPGTWGGCSRTDENVFSNKLGKRWNKLIIIYML